MPCSQKQGLSAQARLYALCFQVLGLHNPRLGVQINTNCFTTFLDSYFQSECLLNICMCSCTTVKSLTLSS